MVQEGKKNPGGAAAPCPLLLAPMLQMRTTVLFGANNFGFFEIYDVSARTRGRSEVIYSQFCGDIFYGQPLLTIFDNYSI